MPIESIILVVEKDRECKLCGALAQVHDDDTDEDFCSDCWHKYPTGLKGVGWRTIVRKNSARHIFILTNEGRVK